MYIPASALFTATAMPGVTSHATVWFGTIDPNTPTDLDDPLPRDEDPDGIVETTETVTETLPGAPPDPDGDEDD